ncbi:MAG: YfiR family protein [Oligoflexia bacterium]|nr:YfiR family protein [Oligoflexia bacterium]
MVRGIQRVSWMILLVARLTWAETQYSAEDVKCAYTLNFAKFIDWPPDVFGSPRDGFHICVPAQGAIADRMEALYSGQRVQNRAIELLKLSERDSWSRCQVAYLNGLAHGARERVLSALRGKPVLTIGESHEFNREGGVIQLRHAGVHIRFSVNLNAAEKARLRISSKLLKLAEEVR